MGPKPFVSCSPGSWDGSAQRRPPPLPPPIHELLLDLVPYRANWTTRVPPASRAQPVPEVAAGRLPTWQCPLV